MARDPYLSPTPAAVSYSGGRTSGMMLRRILDAHGGELPPEILVLFANTGKERAETLDYIHETETRWGVPVVWLEYRSREGKHGFEVVTYETAGRDGEPFDALLKHLAHYRAKEKGKPPVLPNPVQRFCTAELKIRTMRRYLRSLGWDLKESYCVVGLRADEPRRVSNLAASDWECGEPVCPLYDAGVTEADVMKFWAAQPFDLKLQQHEGNCDLCFLKRTGKLTEIMGRRPDLAEWWIAKEAETGQRFRKDRPGYAALLRQSREQGTLDLGDDDMPACYCTG